MQENNNEQNENLNSTVQNTNVEPNVLPVEENVVTPENVVTQPIEPTTSQPQDNYLSGIVPPQTESKKNNNKLIIGVVVVILLVMVVLCIIKMLPKAEKSNNGDNTSTTITTTTKPIEEEIPEEEITSDYTKGDIFYFYESTYENGGKYYYALTDKEEVEKLLGQYTCQSEVCDYFEFNGKDITLYDNGNYFIYNIANKKTTVIDIPKIKYNKIEVVSKDNKYMGVILDRIIDVEVNKYDYGYYDLTKKKFAIGFGEYTEIYTREDATKLGYIFVSTKNNTSLYNINNDKIEKTGVTGILSNNNATYYYDSYRESIYEYITKIYSSDFKVVADNLNVEEEKYYFTNDGKLIYTTFNNTQISIIENNKVTNKEFKFDEIYNVIQDYLVVKNNNYLVLTDYNGKEIVKLTELIDEMKVSTYDTGWYHEGDKKGVYVMVDISEITDCNSLSKEKFDLLFGEMDGKKLTSEESMETCKTFNNDDYLLEYYYKPSTGEIEKYMTMIGGYAKPVLYMYPTTDNTKVKVNFENEELLTTTYPKFNKEWNVTVNKNGDMYDENGRYYYGLYWEESGSNKVDYETGFYVTKENALTFLEEKLDEIGLTEREANEFIMYWLPILEKNKKNLVYFELTEERDSYNKINISPKPDSMLRMAIHVKKVNKAVKIKPQKLTKFNRTGFSVVEWGGVID